MVLLARQDQQTNYSTHLKKLPPKPESSGGRKPLTKETSVCLFLQTDLPPNGALILHRILSACLYFFHKSVIAMMKLETQTMVIKNSNNCETCDFKSYPHEGSHCYMFKDPPKDICLSHTSRKKPWCPTCIEELFDTVFVEKGQK